MAYFVKDDISSKKDRVHSFLLNMPPANIYIHIMPPVNIYIHIITK